MSMALKIEIDGITSYLLSFFSPGTLIDYDTSTTGRGYFASATNPIYDLWRAGATTYGFQSVEVNMNSADPTQIHDIKMGALLITNRKGVNANGQQVDWGAVRYTDEVASNGRYKIFNLLTGAQINSYIAADYGLSEGEKYFNCILDTNNQLFHICEVYFGTHTSVYDADTNTYSVIMQLDDYSAGYRWNKNDNRTGVATYPAWNTTAVQQARLFYELIQSAIYDSDQDWRTYTSTTGGGDGQYIQDGDVIDATSQEYVDLLNQTGAGNTGFIKLYAPTLANLQMLARYMWSTDATITQLKKIFTDPMDAIITLNQIPYDVDTGSGQTIKLGFIDTEIPCPTCEKEFYRIDCGTLTIPEKWGTALDYAPATNVQIYLPFIGARQLSADDVIGKTVQLIYIINVFECCCTAQILVNGTLKYSFDGNIGARIPVSSGNFSDVYLAIARAAGTIIAPSIAGAAGTIASGIEKESELSSGEVAISASAELAGAVGRSALEIMSTKPTVARGTVTSGNNSLMSCMTPYLIIERPKQSLPENYGSVLGYPSHIWARLSSLSGFTQVEDINLQGISATSQELADIERLLKMGVIL